MDRRLAMRAGVALLIANLRYWSGVAPLVRRELDRWLRRAQAIADPDLRELALQKLGEEGFNAELAAMLATHAPPQHRRRVVEAMVALEVLYDYLDGLTESPSPAAPQDGRRLFTALRDAVDPWIEPAGDYYRHHPRSADGGYLEELVRTARLALAALPATGTLVDVLRRSAARGAEAQLHIHAASLTGPGALERWARARAAGTSLQWQEFLAGAACSVLAIHALVAAAADERTTHEQALELDRIYLSVSVLPTVLDSLIDYERDLRAGRLGFIRYYADRATLAGRLASTIQNALGRARSAPDGAHHAMILVGVVAYYTSAPTARTEFARPVTELLDRQLQPLITPTLAMMRAWRTAKRMRAHRPRRSNERIGRGP